MNSFERPNVVQSFNTRRQTSVQAEKLIFHNGCERKVVKKFSEAFPDVGVAIFSTAFIVEAINLSDLPGFMISSEDGDSVFISDFEG